MKNIIIALFAVALLCVAAPEKAEAQVVAANARRTPVRDFLFGRRNVVVANSQALVVNNRGRQAIVVNPFVNAVQLNTGFGFAQPVIVNPAFVDPRLRVSRQLITPQLVQPVYAQPVQLQQRAFVRSGCRF